jgi:hypothetical protein
MPLLPRVAEPRRTAGDADREALRLPSRCTGVRPGVSVPSEGPGVRSVGTGVFSAGVGGFESSSWSCFTTGCAGASPAAAVSVLCGVVVGAASLLLERPEAAPALPPRAALGARAAFGGMVGCGPLRE